MKLSIVIPTYNEKENIQSLIEQIQKEFKNNNIKGEIIIVDDNSPDGTGKIVETLKTKQKNIKIIHRKGKLGLSSAVLEGWKISSGDVLGVMDADLSHPPGKISEMLSPIEKGEADLTIGSRYIKGGKIVGWGMLRKVMSRTATFLARVYTKVKDPMTGFFMIKKDCLEKTNLNPRGFKILLEVIIKADYRKVKEIPITFTNRQEGKSKAGFGEIFYYLKNLMSYLPYKRNLFVEFSKFAIVGLIGTFINLILLYTLTEFLGVYYLASAVIAFVVAMTNNFLLNKIWTFKEKLKHSVTGKYLRFFAVSLSALVVNIIVLYVLTEFIGVYYLISQVIAIGTALIINFLGNKIWTFG